MATAKLQKIPMTPALPVAAQAKPYKVHLKLPDGTYGSLLLLSMPSDVKGVLTAGLKGRSAVEDSYSGSGHQYVKCAVAPDPANPALFLVTVGQTLICRGVIDPGIPAIL